MVNIFIGNFLAANVHYWQKSISTITLLAAISYSFNCIANAEDIGYASYPDYLSNNYNDTLIASFLDIGQGLCVLVNCPGTADAFIYDCGTSGDSSYNDIDIKNIISKTLSKNPNSATNARVIISHPHADHYNKIKLLSDKIRNDTIVYFVGGREAIYKKRNIKFSNNKVTYLGDKSKAPALPTSYSCGTAKIHVIYANTEDKSDLNAYSVVVYIAYKKNGILLMGDLPSLEQNQTKSAIEENNNIKTLITNSNNLYVSSHHGAEAKASISKDLFERINPETVIVSAGEDNGYLHPRESAIDTFIRELQRLQKNGYQQKHYIQVYQPATNTNVAQNNKAISSYFIDITDSIKRLCNTIYKNGCEGIAKIINRKRSRSTSQQAPQAPQVQQTSSNLANKPPPSSKPTKYIIPPDKNELEKVAAELQGYINRIDHLDFKYKSTNKYINLKKHITGILFSIRNQLAALDKEPQYDGREIHRSFQLADTLSAATIKTKDQTLQDYEVTENIYTTKSSGTITYEIHKDGTVKMKCYYIEAKNSNRCSSAKKSTN